MASKGREMTNIKDKKSSLQKSYFDVLGLCCTSEVPLIEKILKPLEGVIEVSVIVPSRTVIVVHDTHLISQLQIVKLLNQARLEANVRVIGKKNYRGRWPSPYVILSGLLLALSFLKYVYHPLQWLAVAAVAVGVWPIILRGVVAVRNFTLDVNILMLIAVVGTIVMRDYTEAGTIVFLFTIAEWLETRASHKATAVMSSLMSMAPQKATIAETGEVVNVEDVKLNTILAVKAGESIPVDGTVVEGTCEVDEKTLTGESFPVTKQKDSIVWAGTVNVNGYISVKTTALAEDCAVAKMAKLVEEAQNNKSSVQRLIDRCAKYYTPAVVIISGGLAVVPAIMKLHDLRHWFHLALVVLVSACPCGLILSTPVATFCALSRAASAGLLIKGGDYLELLAKLKYIAFDKTGTLTRGEFTLMNFQSLADDVSLSTLLYWVSSIESKSSHPIAEVLVDYGRSKSVEPKPENVDEFQNFPGEGVFGRIDGREIFIGNRKLGQRAKCTAASNIGGDTKEGRTSGYIYSGEVVIGTFSLSDNCRSGAKDAIRDLKRMGIRTALLTGDGQSAAMHAQEQLGHALDVVHAELLPEDKARIIKEYKQEGVTAMVGDGVNDAPALATADVGISMGVSGSALANETGHVVLMSNDIRKIPTAIKLARRTRWKVIQNIVFSIATKAGVLAFAFAGHPLVWVAVLADVATCLIVILNSMLLLRGSHGHGKRSHSHKSKCSSTSQHCSKTSQKCCSETTAPKTCSSSQNCSTPCHTSKCTDSENGLHHHLDAHHSHDMHAHHSHDMDAHHSHDMDAHHSHDNNCSSHATPECASECHSDPHTSSPCEGKACGGSDAGRSTCCEEDHCLDMLESQGCCVGDTKNKEGICCNDQSCELVKNEATSDCVHDHSQDPNQNSSVEEHHIEINNEHDHEQKTCCDGEKTACGVQKHSSSQASHAVDVPHNDNGSRCHSHEIHEAHHTDKNLLRCHSHEHHGAHDHHVVGHNEKNRSLCHSHGAHHHVVSHGSCHGHGGAMARHHACSSLRKREVGACCRSYRKECCSGSNGHFVAGFGGLTEIITE